MLKPLVQITTVSFLRNQSEVDKIAKKEKLSRPTTQNSGPKAIILLYHRITDTEYDPHGLAVSPRNFQEHMKYLKRNYIVISLNCLISSLVQGRLPKKSVVISFDDGYADNYFCARPVLEAFNVPATFFIVTNTINMNDAFWWDSLARVFCPTRTLPESLALRFNRKNFIFRLPDSRQKVAVFWRVYGLLRRSSPAVIERSIIYLEQWAKVSSVKVSYRTMNAEEIRKLANSGFFHIGAHTKYHSRLSQQTAASQKKTIAQSKTKLEKIAGVPVTLFSYPYGSRDDYTAETVDIVKGCGFLAACSAYDGTVGLGADLYSLPRFCIENWGLAEFKKHIERYFSL